MSGSRQVLRNRLQFLATHRRMSASVTVGNSDYIVVHRRIGMGGTLNPREMRPYGGILGANHTIIVSDKCIILSQEIILAFAASQRRDHHHHVEIGDFGGFFLATCPACLCRLTNSEQCQRHRAAPSPRLNHIASPALIVLRQGSAKAVYRILKMRGEAKLTTKAVVLVIENLALSHSRRSIA